MAGVTGISVFTKETFDSLNQAHTREFAPLYGYLEDPICGMAAGAIYTYLGSKTKIRIEQGNFCHSSGLIIVETDGANGVWIGGSYCVIASK